MAYDKQIPNKSENPSEWYTKTLQEAGISDYGPAKGSIIFRPYGYRIWELVQEFMNPKIRERGVENAYFPLLIPESLINREKSHIEGFSPELAVVTIGGGEELEEKLVVRPTSETIMYESYSRWIQSWRDLPMMMNQWNNVVRWEKRTFPFIRNSEFLWQEGHTAHSTHAEAREIQSWAMNMYVDVYRTLFALPGYVGSKSESEKFAGADSTLTYETLMPDGKALQSCTSHDLGQNFSRSFDIRFQSKEGSEEFAWQTSWGLSTRSLGGLFMFHGDNAGLVLPPLLAPTQVVIIPVRMQDDVLAYCEEVRSTLSKEGIRVKIDDTDGESFGFKINKWELRGAPLRIEIGPREAGDRLISGTLRDKTKLEPIPVEQCQVAIKTTLTKIQNQLLANAEEYLRDHTFDVPDYTAFKRQMDGSKGFIRAFWCEDATCEAAIKAETTATTRCLPLDSIEETGKCVRCAKAARHKWIFAQAY